MCRWEILFGVKQTTTHESWQLFKNAVRPMWWLRALGCAKMMVNERLVPSRFEILDSLQTRVRKKCHEELPTLKMLIFANRKVLIHPRLVLAETSRRSNLSKPTSERDVFAHVPKDPNCDVCKVTKTIRAQCRCQPDARNDRALRDNSFCRCRFCRPQHSD